MRSERRLPVRQDPGAGGALLAARQVCGPLPRGLACECHLPTYDRMFERIAADWSLPPVVDHTPISEQFPLACDFVSRVMDENAKKHLLIPMVDPHGRRPFFLSSHSLVWANETGKGGNGDERRGRHRHQHDNNYNRGIDGRGRSAGMRARLDVGDARNLSKVEVDDSGPPISHYRFTADAVALTRSKLGRYEQIWRQYQMVKNATKDESRLRKAELELDGMSRDAADAAKVGATARPSDFWEKYMRARLERYAKELAMFVPRGDPGATWQFVGEVRSKPTCVNLNLLATVEERRMLRRGRKKAVSLALLRAAHANGRRARGHIQPHQRHGRRGQCAA